MEIEEKELFPFYTFPPKFYGEAKDFMGGVLLNGVTFFLLVWDIILGLHLLNSNKKVLLGVIGELNP